MSPEPELKPLSHGFPKKNALIMVGTQVAMATIQVTAFGDCSSTCMEVPQNGPHLPESQP